MKYISFIDECGNTGTNLLDQKQSLFTLACVSVPEVSAECLRQKVNAVFESLKEKDEKELKTRKWVKSKAKRDGMNRLLEEVRHQECQVSFVVVDKLWMLSSLVVQNFLDPQYNPNVKVLGDELFNPVSTRQIADYFYSVIDKGNEKIIASAFRDRTLESLKKALDYLVLITDNPEFKEILEGCDAKKLYEDDISTNIWAKEGVEYSPNIPAFAELGRLLSTRLENLASKTDIVFDHCVEFDESLIAINEFCKDFQYVEEMERILGVNTWDGFIERFNVADSKSEPLLSLADIAATGISKTSEKVLKEEPLNEFEGAILKVMERSMAQGQFCFLMSPSHCRRILTAIML